MTWLQNSWYQAGWSNEIEIGKPLTRTILNDPILFWRREDGSIAALFDRCPHRFAPLSAGRIDGDVVICGYHGLGFGHNGHCIANPHSPITSRMAVKSYPVVERHSAVWVWMGAAEQADETRVPDLSFIDETPERATIRMYMPTHANYQLLVDNILDLSHADYLHPTTLGGIMTGAKFTSCEDGERIIVEWVSTDCVPPTAYKPMLPEGSNADIWTQVIWQAPALMKLGTAAKIPGVARAQDDESWTLHNMVPETATTSHYFACSTRRFLVDNDGLTAMLRGALEKAFVQEDKPMLEKQQSAMKTEDLWSLHPILLPIDAGAVRVRRKLAALIAAEQAELGTV